MYDKIVQIINNILKEQLNINSNVDTSSNLMELGIDSIGFMILVVYLENELGIEININFILDKEYGTIIIGDVINAIVEENTESCY